MSNPTVLSNPLHPDLQRTLLLGLSRAPLSKQALTLPAISDPLFTDALPEVAIWQLLATRAVMNRAGYQAASVNVRLTAADPDHKPKCPRQAEQIFTLLQKDIHVELLDEWLYLLNQQGYSMPHVYLPALFDLGRKRPHLRAEVLSVADQRGAWLLQQHSTWGDFYLDGATEPDKDWRTGNVKKRSEALRRMRMRDRDSALTALQQDWKQETFDSRMALLPLLAAQLSMADEPFLESVLDDSRREVRSVAQQLLRGLPESRLVQRCTALTGSLLTLEKKLFRASTLQVTLPETGGAALLRDGIYPERYRSLGDKASTLLYLLASVPPLHWLHTVAAHATRSVAADRVERACLPAADRATTGLHQRTQS